MNSPALAKISSTRAGGRILVALTLVLPWCLWLITRWTLTPVGAVDAWIYRGLGQNLPDSYRIFPNFYYAARLYVLLPRYFLHTFLPQGVAHATFSFGCLYVFLFALDDFAAPFATWRTRFFLILFAASCPYILRSEGWGYVDGFVISSFALSLAFLGRAVRRQSSAKRAAYGALSGACFSSMMITHPMAAVLGFTLLWYFIFEQFFVQRQFRVLQVLADGLFFGVGGILAILVMCIISRLVLGQFWFFLPVIDAAIHISTHHDLWRFVDYRWLRRADWLLIPTLAWLGSTLLLATAAMRWSLTRFERFAYINAALLLGTIVLLDFYGGGFWLQFSFYASYFLPASLMAIAAMLGESSSEQPRVWNVVGLAALLVFIAAVVHNLQKPFLAALSYPPGNLDMPLGHVFNFFGFQLGAVVVTLLLILAHRVVLRRRSAETCWLLAAICGCGVVMLGQVSHYASPQGSDIETSRSIARDIQSIQQELGPARPLFWFDETSPLRWQYTSINSAYLWGYTNLSRAFPVIGLPYRPESHSITDTTDQPWLGGEHIVILTEFPDKMPLALEGFHNRDLDLVESRRIYNPNGKYWIIFAQTVNIPVARRFLPAQIPTTLKNSRLLEPGPDGHSARTTAGEEGFLAYVPYTQLAAGRYIVSFLLRIDGDRQANDIFRLDITAEIPKSVVLVSRTIHAGELDTLARYQKFDLDVTTKSAVAGVQFRVFTYGTNPMTLDGISVNSISGKNAHGGT